VVRFVLMYAQTATGGLANTPVPGFDPIPDGAVIQPSQYNSQPITIRAVTDPLPTGSVQFVLTGAASRTQMENIDPYCLFGDDPHWQYNPWIPTPPVYGTYQLTGTPYTGTAGSGTAGTPLTIGFTLAPPPTPLAANFDWYEIGSSRNVQFTDLSTGGATSWMWDFDDGATSTEQNPRHRFSSGSYDVTLTVTRSTDGATSAITRRVTV
jgi:PKD repeat protein